MNGHFITRSQLVMPPPNLSPSRSDTTPALTQALLAAAVTHWDDSSRSNHYIQAALAAELVGESSLDVWVSAYRYYFYKGDAVRALQCAETICDRLRQTEQWPTDWTQLQPILLAHLEDPNPRLYANAYAASGLLHARLGQLEQAQIIATQVQTLQAKEFGADTLLGILNAPPDDEEDDEE